MGGFSSWEQEELLKPYVGKYFEVLLDVFAKRSRTYAEEFFHMMKPREVSEEVSKQYEELQGKVKEEEKTLKKLVLEELADNKRTLTAQKLYLAGIHKS